jgi:hypothetical protein
MRAFGLVSVRGRSLVPNPAAKIMAFMVLRVAKFSGKKKQRF